MFGRRANLRPTNTYTDWRWPPTPHGYSRFDWGLGPENDPTPDGYFWSHQFGLVGGEAGYVGLQTLGAMPTGKIAIFSIWGAEASEGPEMAESFGGEGTGKTARIAYPWRPGSAYRLWLAASGPATWEAGVVDAASGDEHVIGRIRVPPRWGGLSDFSIMWTERYSGPLGSCADIRHASARFTTPVADSTVAPVSHHNHLQVPSGCPGSEVVDLVDGVRHVMRGPASSAAHGPRSG